MGCSASKGSSRKRTARESWYTPLSRSASAPIHYVPEVAPDDCHLQGSPSTLYTFIQREAAIDKMNGGTLAVMLQEDSLADHSPPHSIYGHDGYSVTERAFNMYASESRKRFASTKGYTKYNSKLKPVKEGPESDHVYDVEMINTWELMKGLDEDNDDESRTASPVRMPPTYSAFEKSRSFNTVHGLDSCFAEMGSPVWHPHFASQDAESGKLGAKQNETTATPPAKSPLRSPMRSPARSPWRTPVWSPLKSPIRSPLKSPSSPLFDPALLAKFEQAIDASMMPHDEWLLTQSLNEGSRTTSSSSSFNETWVSSETSSDGESAQYAPKESFSRINMSQETSTGLKDVHMPYNLESFEPSCPPKGEDKVVLYFTSLRGVRKTYEECCVLRRILQGLGVYVDERDVWMHSRFREELTELLDNKGMQVPRLFIKGRYIGGMEDVCQLHEDGFLIRLIEGLPCVGMFRKACEGCTGVRFVPCVTCRGSCKVVDEEDSVIRCGECNENGLIMCPLCS